MRKCKGLEALCKFIQTLMLLDAHIGAQPHPLEVLLKLAFLLQMKAVSRLCWLYLLAPIVVNSASGCCLCFILIRFNRISRIDRCPDLSSYNCPEQTNYSLRKYLIVFTVIFRYGRIHPDLCEFLDNFT